MKAIVDETTFEMQQTEGNWLADTSSQISIEEISKGKKLVLINGQKYEARLLQINKEDKTVTLQLNNKKVTVQMKEPLDDLLHSMGLDTALQTKAQDIKAPMPGLVLDILVTEGQSVEKGEKVLVLEAMKMENAIKAAAAGVVKRVCITKGTAVEKNQVLIEMV